MATPRVLIIAPDPLARAGLATLLTDQVVGQVGLTPDLVAEVEVYRPDVIVYDAGWEPDLEPLADLQEIDIPIVVLLPEATQAPAAWEAGARGLLLRDAGAERLLTAIQAVFQDLVICDPSLAPTRFSGEQSGYGQPVEPLSPRELEVLRLLAEGLPNKTIARRLDISEHTVKFHVNAIMGKLGAQSRTEAAVRAARLGLIML